MQHTDHIHTKTTELLENLQLPVQSTVDFDDQTGYYQIQLDTDMPGLLIGYRGETLAALQLLLGLMINNPKTDEWKKVIVNVGDYRQRREETLTQIAHNAAQRVTFSGEPYYFEYLSPAERRIVHLVLQDHDQINTHSEGEGKHRRLVVVLK